MNAVFWMAVFLGLSVNIVSKVGTILEWKSLNGLRITSENQNAWLIWLAADKHLHDLTKILKTMLFGTKLLTYWEIHPQLTKHLDLHEICEITITWESIFSGCRPYTFVVAAQNIGMMNFSHLQLWAGFRCDDNQQWQLLFIYRFFVYCNCQWTQIIIASLNTNFTTWKKKMYLNNKHKCCCWAWAL